MRSRLTVFILLAVAYLLPGLFGHEPWKPDEPYTLGVARTMLQSGDWVVPRVTDVPFVEKPPLFYWACAIAIRTFGVLPQHDAARIASLFFVLVTLAAGAAAAALCWGRGAATMAALLLLGMLGLEGHAQRLQVDHALMAGFAIAMLGFAAQARSKAWAGLAIGAGLGIGFLAKGLVAPAAIGATALMLPCLFREWRVRAYSLQLAEAALVAAPLVIGWPLALWLRDPSLFYEWFWENNIGRFLGFSITKLGAEAEPGAWLFTLPWFLFPAWIYAVGSLWRERAAAWREPGVQIGATLVGAVMLLLFASASGRAVYALPMLPPLALLAARADSPREGAVGRGFARFSIALACVAAVAIWGVWSCLVDTGVVPEWTKLARTLPVPFTMPVNASLIAAAVALTAGFAILVALGDRIPHRPLALWIGALALGWGLTMTLWLPWLDAAKGYREVFEDMAQHVPAGCLALSRLGESERAMVEYYTNRTTSTRAADCDTLLWRRKAITRKHRPPPEVWREVWSGARAGDTNETYELLVRRQSNPVSAAR